MKILINPKHFHINDFQSLITHLPDIDFVDDIDDVEIEGMITWSSAVKKDVLERYPKLKIIMLPSAGYDQADIAYLKERGIIMTNARGVYDIQIVEDVIAKISYINRDIKHFQEKMNDQLWDNHGNFAEIYGSTVGIIGTGSIGRRLAKVLKGFDAHVIGYRRIDASVPEFDQVYTGEQGLKTLLNQSDYVILAVPLTSQTKHLINEHTLEDMKKNALLINIARGDVIDQNALIKALNDDVIRGAALDVTTPEPLLSDDPLWQTKHLYITPHTAGRSPKAFERANALLLRIIKAFTQDEPLENRIC